MHGVIIMGYTQKTKEEYLADLAASPAGELVRASYAHLRKPPAGKNPHDYTEDWKDPKYDWEYCAYPNSVTAGSGPQPVNIYYSKCRNTLVCRSTVIDEYYEKSALEVRVAPPKTKVERLKETLAKVKEACLFVHEDGTIGVTEDAHIPTELFDEILTALEL